jgi:hypothetical protein
MLVSLEKAVNPIATKDVRITWEEMTEMLYV